MPKPITKAYFKSQQKQIARAVKDKARIRREALALISAARAAGHSGRVVLAREDACGSYMNARHDLAQQHAQLRDVYVMNN